MRTFSIWIPGTTATKGSTTSNVTKSGKVVTRAAHPKLQMFEAIIREKSSVAWDAPPSPKPFDLSVEYHAVRPRSHYGTGKNSSTLKPFHPRMMTKKPDLSKIIRAVEDGMNKIVYLDDQQICSIRAVKQYSEKEGVKITITEIVDGIG